MFQLFSAIICSILLFRTSHGYVLQAKDVSSTTFYQELIQRNMLVVDTSRPHYLEARSTNASGSLIVPSTNSFPQPFDTSIGNNFTQTSCPAFFTAFLSNATFQSCVPVSLLLQNSISFFKAAKSASTLDQTLDASCSASLALCAPLMSHYASQLVDNANCGADYKLQNPLVQQAYNGLQAYEVTYKSTCLKDSATNEYCFTEAMVPNQNSSNQYDSYPYYTAVGLPLPSGAQPSCSSCLQQTMSMFSNYAVQKDQPLSQTYLPCAMQVDQTCGNSFATTSVKIASSAQTKNAGNREESNLGVAILSVAALIAVFW